MRRMILILLTLLLALSAAPALAEDVCTVRDALQAADLITECSYIHLRFDLEAESCVTISVRDAWGGLIYQRDYGMKSGAFRSGDIHLPLEGERSEYRVSIRTDAGEHSFVVTREMAMLTDSAVYAGGLTLKEMVDGSRRKYAVVLDMDAMNEETSIAPMLAGGMQVGEVYFSVLDGELTVSAVLTAEGTIDKATVYIAADAITAQTLGASRFTGVKTRLDRTIDLGDTPYAAVMVQLTVTYDPATAQAWEMTREAEKVYEELLEDWELMQMMTANEAVG